MQIFSRFLILFTVFNQIRLKSYQIKTNKIFNFSHKISQKRHFVAQKRLFLYEIRDFSRKMPHLFHQDRFFQQRIVEIIIRRNHVTAEAPAAVVPLEAWSPMTL